MMTRALMAIFLLAFVSCSSNKRSPNIQKSATTIKATAGRQTIAAKTNIVDTDNLFTVDDYPVTDDMIDGIKTTDPSYQRQSGRLYSFDKAWFTSQELKQTLVFDMYTDHHRVAIFHFSDDDVPDTLISQMELHTNNGSELASLVQKKKEFIGFVDLATNIDQKYFTTIKSFRLGDDKEKALSVYGNPDKTSRENNIEILEWDFGGDGFGDPELERKGNKMAKDSYGHETMMFFRNNKLIAMILHNDIL